MTSIVRSPSARDSDAPLLVLAGVLLRHIRLMVLIPFVIFALTVTLGVLRREYWAQSKLSPQTQEAGGASGLAGIAATFGVGLPLGRNSESLDFYAELLKSREILDSVVLTNYRFPIGPLERDTMSGTLMDIYHVNGRTPEERMIRARRKLERRVTATVRRTANLVVLRTTSKWPRLAEQMNRRLLDLVNDFNTHRRQSQAGAERRFLEDRITAVRAEKDAAQDAERRFLEKNRVWQNDPRLTLEMQQLNQEVQRRVQVFQTISENYEKARIDEVRNTPVITVVEGPEGSRRREAGLWLKGVVALVTGTILALGLALALEYTRREQALHPEEADTLRALIRTAPSRLLRGR